MAFRSDFGHGFSGGGWNDTVAALREYTANGGTVVVATGRPAGAAARNPFKTDPNRRQSEPPNRGHTYPKSTKRGQP